jgi:hypothetical protein
MVLFACCVALLGILLCYLLTVHLLSQRRQTLLKLKDDLSQILEREKWLERERERLQDEHPSA